MLKSKSLPILAGAAALGLLVSASHDAAATTFDITSCELSIACPTGGTIDVTQVGTTSGQVDVSVTLAPNEIFAETGAGGKQSVLFNLSGTPNLTITTLSANLSPLALANGGVAGSIMADGAGTFQYGVNCDSASPTPCGGGTSPPFLTSPIEFDLSGTGLTPASFVTNGTAIFALDVGVCTGTGTCPSDSNPVAGTGVVDVVPVPVIGHGLLVFLAVGGVLFGGKLFESLKMRRSLAA